MKNFFMFLMLAATCGATTGQKVLPDAKAYVIADVNVVDVRAGQILTDRDVYIKDGWIEAVVSSNAAPEPGQWDTIAGHDRFLMPGISEMHAHIPVPRNGDDTHVRETLFLYLSNGITTIRGMLGDPYHLELKQQIASGEILSPRVYTSSPSLNGNSVQTPDEAARKVAQYAENGYDFLKIHPGIALPVMERLVRTAGEVNIPFAGHVPYDVGVRRALAFGYASIDHADGYIEGLTPEGTDYNSGGFFGSNFVDEVNMEGLPALCAETAAKGVWIVPTQSLFTRWISPEPPEAMIQAKEMQYMPARVRHSWVRGKSQIVNNPDYSAEDYQAFLELRRQILKCLYDAGAPFLLGSDAPQVFNVPGFSIQHEMRAVADAGIPVVDVLRSGTINPAVFFGAEGEYGEVSHRAAADLILLDANPLDDITNMERIAGVMVRGIWLSRKRIDQELLQIAARHENE